MFTVNPVSNSTTQSAPSSDAQSARDRAISALMGTAPAVDQNAISPEEMKAVSGPVKQLSPLQVRLARKKNRSRPSMPYLRGKRKHSGLRPPNKSKLSKQERQHSQQESLKSPTKQAMTHRSLFLSMI
jgi:hypothetical protein